MKVLARMLTILSLGALVMGCGFALRGSGAVSSGIPALALNLQQPTADLSRALLRELSIAQVQIQSLAGDTPADLPVLSVSAEAFTSRPVTVNPRARAAQYTLTLAVTISVQRQNEVLLEPEDLVSERLFYESLETITGNLDELRTLQDDMRRELAQQVIRRLAALPRGT